MDIPRLESLRLSAFRSFPGPTSIKFPERGLVLVSAKNLDTGGHSGAGKTNLLMGLAYAFGYAPVPATLLQRRGTEKSMEVQVTFGTPKGRATLTRGSRASLEVDGEPTVKGSVAAVEKRLEQLLGLSPKLLEALTYRGQNERSMFLSANDEAKKEFLAEAIPELEKFEIEAEEAERNAKVMAGHLKNAEEVLAVALRTRDQLEAMVPPPPDTEIYVLRAAIKAREDAVAKQEQALAVAEKACADAEKARKAREQYIKDAIEKVVSEGDLACAQLRAAPWKSFDDSELKKQLAHQAECNKRIAAAKTKEADRLATMHAEENRLRKLVDENMALSARAAHNQANIDRLKHDILHLRGAACPTCERPWEDTGKKLAEAEAALRNEEEALKNAQAAKALALHFQEQLDALVFESDPTIAKLEAAARVIVGNVACEKAKVDSDKQIQSLLRDQQVARIRAEVELKRVELLQDQEFERLEAESDKLAEAYVEERLAMKDAKQALDQAVVDLVAVEKADAARENALKRVAAAEERIRECRVDVEDFREKYAREADLALLLGNQGFLGAIFDEILEEISDETNSILATIPNTAHISICYRSELQTKKGEKRVIVPVLRESGVEVPLKGIISGGQMTSLELATDLAVSRVISRRTGVVPGWMIFDESFNGLGIVEKEGALEMLAQHAQDRLVLVVDHDNQFREMFTKMISLEFSDGVTVVKEAL